MRNIVASARAGFGLPPLVWVLATLVLALHLAVAGRYDFFRNELYFIDCGRHPAFGYADQPMLAPLLAAMTQLFGENLFLLRLPAALAAAALLPLTAAMAQRLGGGALSAAVAVAAAIGLTAISSTFGTSTFEPLGWTLIAYCVLRAVLSGDARTLIAAGVIAGVTFEAKFGVAIWAVGLAIGLAVSPARHLLATRAALIGAAAAAAIGVPAVIWQAAHGFPFLGIVAYHNAEGAVFSGGPVRFWISQIIAMNLVLAPLWLTGLVAPFATGRLAPARPLAVAFAVTAAAIFLARGKDYYLFPAYPALLAIGAAAIARLPAFVRAGWLGLAALNAAFLLPLTLPVLPPAALLAFLDRHHIHPRPNEAAAIGAKITQVFSDEFGWRSLAATVDGIYAALPAEARARTGVFAWNYGEAAAIDVFGRAAGLPRAMSGEDQFYLWGPAGDFSDLILVNVNRDAWTERCRNFAEVARFGDPFAMPYETNRPIFLCRGLKTPLARLWPELQFTRAPAVAGDD